MATTLPAQKVIYNLGPVSRIPLGEGRTFQLEEASIAIFHTRGGQVFATQATCPHRGGPLSDGLVGANQVICPLHAWRFDLKSGHSESQGCEHLATYPVTLSSTGEILLHLCEGVA